METAVVGESSIIQLIKSKDTFERNSAFQELAILSRYPDPRRAQIYQLSVPGGKPRTWDAIWGESSTILNNFVKKMDQINRPEVPKTPTKKIEKEAKSPLAQKSTTQKWVKNYFGLF